jgi:hypothetical protein
MCRCVEDQGHSNIVWTVGSNPTRKTMAWNNEAIHACVALRQARVDLSAEAFAFSEPAQVACLQGDQIGRIFAHYTVAYLGQIFDSYSRFWATLFPNYILCINFDKNWFGLHSGRFFHKLIWSCLLPSFGK